MRPQRRGAAAGVAGQLSKRTDGPAGGGRGLGRSGTSGSRRAGRRVGGCKRPDDSSAIRPLDRPGFDTVMRSAVALDLSPLKLYCVRFAEGSSQVQQQYHMGTLSPEASSLPHPTTVPKCDVSGNVVKACCCTGSMLLGSIKVDNMLLDNMI